MLRTPPSTPFFVISFYISFILFRFISLSLFVLACVYICECISTYVIYMCVQDSHAVRAQSFLYRYALHCCYQERKETLFLFSAVITACYKFFLRKVYVESIAVEIILDTVKKIINFNRLQSTKCKLTSIFSYIMKN